MSHKTPDELRAWLLDGFPAEELRTALTIWNLFEKHQVQEAKRKAIIEAALREAEKTETARR